MSLPRKTAVMILSLICAALAAAATFSEAFVCYAVSVDGEHIGLAQTRAQTESALTEAERRASAILGEDVSLAGSLTVTTNLGSADTTADDITATLLDSVDGIIYVPAIIMDGTPVGSADTELELRNILRTISAKYTNDNTISATFKQDVTVSFTYTAQDIETDPEAILALLDPENKTSPYALTVVTTDRTAVDQPIEPETVFVPDDNMWSDEFVVEEEGQPGVDRSRYIFEKENGLVVKRTLLGHIQVEAAAPRVVRVGAKASSRTDSTGEYIWPTTGIISSYFGRRSVSVGSSNHRGVDIANDKNTEIWASDGGTVIHAEWTEGYGMFIKIQHDNGDVTAYGHMCEFAVEVGDKVSQGDIIGYMGNTGVSSGPHLHFELRLGGDTKVNPKRYMVDTLELGTLADRY